MEETRNISQVTWREDLYPRFEPTPARIQQYAECVDFLPPIEINQHDELIDGYHRWTALLEQSRSALHDAIFALVDQDSCEVAEMRAVIEALDEVLDD